MSNFDYLMALNHLVGRHEGNRKFHAVLPWVIDMTAPPEPTMDDGQAAAAGCTSCAADGEDGHHAEEEAPEPGWRDLRKTKWRLAKGDEQVRPRLSAALGFPARVSS